MTQARAIANLGLLFAAIVEQADELDERCTDPAPTSFILAIHALAQRGFDECARLNVGKPLPYAGKALPDA